MAEHSKEPDTAPQTGAAGKKEDADKKPRDPSIRRSEDVEKGGTGPNETVNKV